MGEFCEVFHHRLRYFLTPQFDMYRNVRECIKQQLGIGGQHDILDYGCGTGVGSVILKYADWGVMGVDSDAEAIAFASDSWGHLIPFFHENWVEGMPKYQSKFDAVVCLEVIEHVHHPHELLRNLTAVLRPGGLAFISTLNHNSQYRKNRGHCGRYTVNEFRRMTEHHMPGVEIVDYELYTLLDDMSSITPMVAKWQRPK